MKKPLSVLLLLLLVLSILLSCQTSLSSGMPMSPPVQVDDQLTITETTGEILVRIKTSLKPINYEFNRFTVVFSDGKYIALDFFQIKEIILEDEYFIMRINSTFFSKKKIIEAGVLLGIKNKGKSELYYYSNKSEKLN